MYKLTVTPKYYRMFMLVDTGATLVLKCTRSVTVSEFATEFCKKTIREGEVDLAIKEMKNQGHNCAEFGPNGYFVVSYTDALVKEEA